MRFVKASEVAAPVIPETEREITVLGGWVRVRGLVLSQMAEARGDWLTRGSLGMVAAIMARSVLDGDYEQLFTAEQWDRFLLDHQRDPQVTDLLAVVKELNGLRPDPDADDEDSESAIEDESEGDSGNSQPA